MANTMQAALIHTYGGIEKVVLERIAAPIPKDNEVKIAVKYAGVNPVDWKISEGYLKTRMDYQFPIILGWDAAGVVVETGKDIKDLQEGDEVFAYCRKEVIHDGSFAEYICLPIENVVKKPKNLNFAEAACIPLSALTAWQALFDSADLKKGEKVLIHAGAGGVGGFAIQFAKLSDAYVFTTASLSNFEYVKHLGADEAIDYVHENFIEKVFNKNHSGVDVVFDTVGDSTLHASFQAVKKGGRLVSIAGVIDQALASKQSITADFVFVRPDRNQLKNIATLFEQEKIIVPRLQEVPLEEVDLALRKSREGHTQGKLVLKIN